MSIKKGYIVPHPPIIWCADNAEDLGKIKETKKSLIKIANEISENKEIDTIILITPHGPIFSDGLCVFSDEILEGDLSEFNGDRESTKIQLKTDLEFLELLIAESIKNNIPIVKLDEQLRRDFQLTSKLDHGTVVPLLFLKEHVVDLKVVIISYGLLSAEKLYDFGMKIEEVSKNLKRNSIIIASGDLSHSVSELSPYGYKENGYIFDRDFVKKFGEGNIEELIFFDKEIVEDALECGKKSIDILFGAFDKYEIRNATLSYEAPFGIGYLVGSIEPIKENVEGKYGNILNIAIMNRDFRISKEDEYVKLARKALTEFLSNETIIPVPKELPKEFFTERGGVFVSLKDSGGLRGCMGTIGGVEANIGEEIIRNAIKAGVEDPRFEELTIEELGDLEITLDVLSKSWEVDSIKDLNPKKYGVIVSSGYKQGLLLPDLKGIDTVYDQLKIVLNKAGIEENEEYKIKLFTVVRHY